MGTINKGSARNNVREVRLKEKCSSLVLYTNGHDQDLYLSLSIPIQGNISLSLGVLFLGSFLPPSRVSSFGIGLSRQCDIEFYIGYGLIFLVSFFIISKYERKIQETALIPTLTGGEFPLY